VDLRTENAARMTVRMPRTMNLKNSTLDGKAILSCYYHRVKRNTGNCMVPMESTTDESRDGKCQLT